MFWCGISITKNHKTLTISYTARLNPVMLPNYDVFLCVFTLLRTTKYNETEISVELQAWVLLWTTGTRLNGFHNWSVAQRENRVFTMDGWGDKEGRLRSVRVHWALPGDGRAARSQWTEKANRGQSQTQKGSVQEVETRNHLAALKRLCPAYLLRWV